MPHKYCSAAGQLNSPRGLLGIATLHVLSADSLGEVGTEGPYAIHGPGQVKSGPQDLDPKTHTMYWCNCDEEENPVMGGGGWGGGDVGQGRITEIHEKHFVANEKKKSTKL